MELYAVFGAGGFGREVMPVVRQCLDTVSGGPARELVFVVENLEQSYVVNGYRVISDAAFLAQPAERRFFNVAIGDGKVRQRIVEKMLASGVTPFSIRAANSVCYDGNEIGEGAVLCAFTTITANVRIGRYFHANIYSYVAHDCVVGDYVTLAPSVHCNGRILIGDHVYVGTGAIIREGRDGAPIVIGEGAVIGMGAVVRKSVPPHTTVVGNPAKALRPVRRG